MSCLLLLCLVAVASANHRLVSLRPLRIYAQNESEAGQAAAAFSRHFNVSIHPQFGQLCKELISLAQRSPGATDVILVSEEKSRDCPRELWTGGFLIDLTDPSTTDWNTQAERISISPEVGPAQNYTIAEEMAPRAVDHVLTSTEKPEESGGVRMPVWVVVILSLLIVIFLIIGSVLLILYLKKKPVKEKATAKKLADQGDKSSKKDSSKKSSKSESSKKTKSDKSSKEDKKDQRSGERPKERNDAAALRSEEVAEKKIDLIQPPERSLEKRLEEPMTKEEFVYHLQILAGHVVDYCEDPAGRSLTNTEKPGFLLKKLPKQLPELPANYKQAEEMLDFLKETVIKGMTNWQHPRQFSYRSSRSYPDMLAELFISSLGVVGTDWASCQSLVEMEYAMVNWIGKALGIPDVFLFTEKIGESRGGGCFLDSSSEAILVSVLAARLKNIRTLAGLKPLVQQTPDNISYDLDTMHDLAKRLVFYCSREAHPSMEKSCKLAMVKCRAVVVDEKTDWSLTGQLLEQDIKKDYERGLVPAYVLVLASDDLHSILPIAKKYQLYVHVDGAAAGMFWMNASQRVKGLEEVDSINVNLHKTMLQSPSSAVLFTRDQKLHLDTCSVGPQSDNSQMDLRSWSIHSSHRFKAWKTWWLINFYGLEGLRRHVNRVLKMTSQLAELVKKHPYLRLIGRIQNGNFQFQYGEKDWTKEQRNKATRTLASHINSSGKLLVSQMRLGDNEVIQIRMASQERMPRWVIEDSYSVLADQVDEFRASMEQKTDRTLEEKRLVGSVNLVTDRTRMSEMSAASPATALSSTKKP